MLPILAANMLGLEKEDAATLDHQYDALKELANVLCGNLLPAIAGPEPEFDVQPPVILRDEADSGIPEGRPPAATAHLTLDAGASKLELFLEDPADAGKPSDEEDSG